MLSKEQVKEVRDIVSEILRSSPVECTSTVTTDQVHVHFEDITYRIFADKIAYRSPGGNWVEKPLDQWAESSSRGGWTKEALKIANEIKVRIDPVEPSLDQPFEFRDQVRCILQSHDVEQSVEEAEKTCITEDGFARIYASELVIVIQPEEEVMHISMVKPNPETRSHGFAEWENMDAEDFPRGIHGYVWWTRNLKPALFEIIELLESHEDDGEIPDDAIGDANAIIVDLRLKLARTENHLKHWKERAELRERERDASRLEYGKLMTKYQELEVREGDAVSYTEGQLAACEKELKQLKEEHHELNEKYINHSSVYEHKIDQQEERICKLIDRLKLYQAAYEQEFLKSMESGKGVTSDS